MCGQIEMEDLTIGGVCMGLGMVSTLLLISFSSFLLFPSLESSDTKVYEPEIRALLG
jgi:hypothetical protein